MMANATIPTDSLLREVQAAAIADRTDAARSSDSLSSKSAVCLRALRAARLKTLAGILDASGMKNSLKARLADANARQALENARAAMRSVLSGARADGKNRDLERSRVLAILKDLEDGRDAFLTDAYRDSSQRLPGDGMVTARNLSAAISAAHETERMNSLDEALRGTRIHNAFEEQKASLRQAVAAMDRSGWIGNLFRAIGAVIAPIAAAAVSLLVPALGVTSIFLHTLLSGLLQNVANGLLQASSWLAQRSPSRDLRHAEVAFNNAEANQATLSRRRAESETSDNRNAAARDRLIRQLEASLGNR